MTDLTPQLLPRLLSHRLPGINLGEGGVHPSYHGGSILNIPASLCQMLGAPGIGAEALDPLILNSLPGSIRRVILVLMDGLAFHRLRRWMTDGTTPIWSTLADDGLLTPLTSVVPSTTSAALLSVWSGKSPAEHGIVGYELWLKEYGVVANMITHAPITYKEDVGSLAKAGFKPREFFSQPTLGAHLARHGIQTYAFQHHSIARSGLSQMFLSQTEVFSFNTSSDLWVNLRRLVEDRPHERQYIWVYWGEVDHFSHHHGPDDERCAAEFTSFSSAFERFFLRRLPQSARQDTLFILTSDHGQISTPLDAQNTLHRHPELNRRLHIQPSGENRLMYLFIRPGQAEAVSEYITRAWDGQFALLEPADTIEKGLFGFGRPHPRLSDRLGDLVVAASQGAYLWWAEKENHLLGRHGGFSSEEMLVPFLAARL